MRSVVFISLTVALCACTQTGGRAFDTSYADRISKGITTKQDIVKNIGPPLQNIMNNWTYKYMISTLDTKNLLIVIPGFYGNVGAGDTSTVELSIGFDGDVVSSCKLTVVDTHLEGLSDLAAPGMNETAKDCGPMTVASPASLPQQSASGPRCPPSGTSVPLTKVMTTNLLASYQGCSIVTTAEFVGMGTAGVGLGGVENSYPMMRVVSPGEPHPGAFQLPTFVALSQSASDLAYSLKSGDQVSLTGGTLVYAPIPTLSVFFASSISRAH